MALADPPATKVARRRGRPVGSDSAETRSRILAASRQVINERGYQAATFQAIAVAAELSRPTLHYYFASREEIYQALTAESGVVVAACIATARQHATPVEQFAALVTAMHDTDVVERSQIAFLVSARLESLRNAELRAYTGLELSEFLTSLVDEARSRGELPADAANEPIVEMLFAMLWGVGFYAGFVDDAADMRLITRQLGRMFSHGLLDCAETSSAPRDT